jgi:hypothetical protein
MVFILAMLGVFAPATLAEGVCPTTESDLQSLISAGDAVSLNCPTDTTIPFSSLITVSNSVTLDASGSAGTVTIDGGGTTELFLVNSDASLTLKQLVLTNGHATQYHHGVLTNEGTLDVENSTISNGAVDANNGIQSSGIDNYGTLTVANSTFSDNNGGLDTGAIYNSGTASVSASTFSGNSGWVGGAIANQFGTLAVDSSTFASNTASDGAAIYSDSNDASQTLSVSNSTFTDNVAQYGSSAITSYDTPTFIQNSTFYGNSGYYTLYTNGAAATLLNSTFAANIISYSSIRADSSTLTFGGNIFDNLSWRSCNLDSKVDLGYNVDPTGYCTGQLSGTGDVGGNAYSGTVADPKVDTLADNGGSTFTAALLTGSPALDLIPTSYTYVDANGDTVSLCPSADQRGTDRPAGSASFCDAGAFESSITPPVITPIVSGTLSSSGWYTSDVNVTWSVDGAGFAITESSGCDATAITTDTTGITLTCTASSAGGTSSQSVTIRRDATAPTMSGTPTTQPNSNGWYKGQVTIHWSCNDMTSYLAACESYSFINNEGANQTVTATASDNAGNTTTATSPAVNIDKTAPTISGAPTTQPNSNGWYDGPVTIHWTCGDTISGIATCPDDTVISTEGANQTVSGTATDNAGRTATAASPAVNIDATAPVVTYSGNQETYTVDQTVAISCSAADQPALSGLASTTCADINQPAADLGAGPHTFSATATDNAGNSGTGSVTITVQVTTDSLTALTEQYASNNVVARVLSAPLKIMQLADRMQNDHLKATAVNLYIRLVNVAQGHGLSAQQAATLTQLAQSL